MNEIQLNTLLGNFWEQVVADCLESIGITYDRSPDLGAGIISPDFVCRKEMVTFFVTCTGTRESFIKKRWRYINELFQAKGVLGDNMLVANLVLAASGNLQDIEEKVFKGLFDIAVFGEDFPDYETHFNWARSQLSAGKSVGDLAADFKGAKKASSFLKELKNWLKKVLASKPSKLTSLWSSVAKYQSGRALTPVTPKQPTYWRWTCLKLLPLNEIERLAVLKGFEGKPIKIDCLRLKYAGICTSKSIGGVRVNDDPIEATLKVFTSTEIITNLKTLDNDNSRIGFPLPEVVDQNIVKAAYKAVKASFADFKSFVKYSQSEYHNQKLDRISIWEYGVALAETSLLDVNKTYVNKWGKIVVANPINNVILKTDISKTIEKKGDINNIIERASKIIWDRMPSKITEAAFVERVMEYRKKSLFLQPYINPTQKHFERVCTSALGVTPQLANQDCLLGDIGIKGRGSRVEAIYILKKSDQKWVFKVLSGYKGGYEHKADEMASRAWLLRFRLNSSESTSYVVPLKLVFVYEGEWDEQYLSLLHASGWDEVIHLSQVESFIKSIAK